MRFSKTFKYNKLKKKNVKKKDLTLLLWVNIKCKVLFRWNRTKKHLHSSNYQDINPFIDSHFKVPKNVN